MIFNLLNNTAYVPYLLGGCSQSGHSRLYGEIIYMHVRELQMQSVILFGDYGPSHLDLAEWIMKALNMNAEEVGNFGAERPFCAFASLAASAAGCFELISILTHGQTGYAIKDLPRSSHVDLVEILVQEQPQGEENDSARAQNKVIRLSLSNLMEGFMRGKWFNASHPLDGLVFSASTSSAVASSLVSHLITPTIAQRDDELPPFAVFFHMFEAHDATERRYLRSLLEQEQVTSNRSQSSKGIPLTHRHEKESNLLLSWLDSARHVHSVDSNVFDGEVLRVVHGIRLQFVSSSCAEELLSQSFHFVYSSVLRSPRATLVGVPPSRHSHSILIP